MLDALGYPWLGMKNNEMTYLSSPDEYRRGNMRLKICKKL
jgi:hypothetical protein